MNDQDPNEQAMAAGHSSIRSEGAGAPTDEPDRIDGKPLAGGESSRKEIADRLPFLLRAWWLREFQEYKDLVWRNEQYTTGPVWSAYSDPGCDMSGLDYAYDVEED